MFDIHGNILEAFKYQKIDGPVTILEKALFKNTYDEAASLIRQEISLFAMPQPTPAPLPMPLKVLSLVLYGDYRYFYDDLGRLSKYQYRQRSYYDIAFDGEWRYDTKDRLTRYSVYYPSLTGVSYEVYTHQPDHVFCEVYLAREGDPTGMFSTKEGELTFHPDGKQATTPGKCPVTYNEQGDLIRFTSNVPISKDNRGYIKSEKQLQQYGDYEYDGQNNWTKRIRYRVFQQEDGEVLIPCEAYYRTITYQQPFRKVFRAPAVVPDLPAVEIIDSSLNEFVARRLPMAHGDTDARVLALRGQVAALSVERSLFSRDGAMRKWRPYADFTFDRHRFVTRIRYYQQNSDLAPILDKDVISVNSYDKQSRIIKRRLEVYAYVQSMIDPPGRFSLVNYSESWFTYNEGGQLVEKRVAVPLETDLQKRHYYYIKRSFDDQGRMTEERFSDELEAVDNIRKYDYEPEVIFCDISDGSSWTEPVWLGRGSYDAGGKPVEWHPDGQPWDYAVSYNEHGDLLRFAAEIDVEPLKPPSLVRGKDSYEVLPQLFGDYEYDDTGNWIKRIRYLVREENGREVLVPYEAICRTITYYPDDE